MQIKLLVEGGNMQPGPAVSQKLGPAGINVNEVIQKVNEATKNFEGIKVPVELEVDSATKEVEVNVFSPPISELLKKEAGVEKGSGDHKKIKSSNISIEQVIKVANTKLPNLLCNDLMAAVKTTVGTCVSLGFLIEGKPAVEVAEEIKEGKYDKEIKEVKTDTDPEKLKKLQDDFKVIKEAQDKQLAKEKAAAEAKEAKK